MIRIVRTTDDGTTTLTVSGRISAEQLPDLRRSIEECRRHRHTFLLDDEAHGLGVLGDIPSAVLQPLEFPDPVAIARLAAAAPALPPRPLYLRPPDAKLPGGIDPPGWAP